MGEVKEMKDRGLEGGGGDLVFAGAEEAVEGAGGVGHDPLEAFVFA